MNECKKFMASVFLGTILGICFLLSGPAFGEVKVGFVHSSDELERARSDWKYRMASTSDRQDKDYRRTLRLGDQYQRSDIVTKKGVTHGVFISCFLPIRESVVIKYAFAYGEPDRDTARKKAAHAFDAAEGNCEANPSFQFITNKDL